jgi:hypothetical protein
MAHRRVLGDAMKLFVRSNWQIVLKLRKLVDQRYKWRSRGLSDFILHMKNSVAQISSQDQLYFFKRSKVRG